MQHIEREAFVIRRKNLDFIDEKGFTADTTFVLFFLALDFGQAWLILGTDGLLAAVTLTMFVVLPYFLSFSGEKPDFGDWVTGRIIIAAIGICFGLMLKQAIGILVPESFKFVPMTLLIVSAAISCYTQLYAILKVRLAR